MISDAWGRWLNERLAEDGAPPDDGRALGSPWTRSRSGSWRRTWPRSCRRRPTRAVRPGWGHRPDPSGQTWSQDRAGLRLPLRTEQGEERVVVAAAPVQAGGQRRTPSCAEPRSLQGGEGGRVLGVGEGFDPLQGQFTEGQVGQGGEGVGGVALAPVLGGEQEVGLGGAVDEVLVGEGYVADGVVPGSRTMKSSRCGPRRRRRAVRGDRGSGRARSRSPGRRPGRRASAGAARRRPAPGG
ncbi:hypothetical protein SMICM17S_11732 [Streptomyces microflavus]